MRLRQFIALSALTLSATAGWPQTPTADAAVPQQPQISSRIPAIAIPALGLETSMAWKSDHDDQTRGWSTGSTNYPIYPDGRNGLSGRQFVASYGDKGGERYHLTFGHDAAATHFVYEANVYLVTPADIANVEMDMNQVLADGRTVIFGTQCSAHSKSWEYTYVDKSGTHWRASNIPCNPETWGAKKWHKIQIASHRDDEGNVTYDWIGFDGVYTDFQNATVFSTQSLGWWPGELLLNFQIDGAHNSGIMDSYLNNLAIYRW
ncbi:MAG: hypothetical protein WCB58_01720 [Acidobacteriaceae bacterium]